MYQMSTDSWDWPKILDTVYAQRKLKKNGNVYFFWNTFGILLKQLLILQAHKHNKWH